MTLSDIAESYKLSSEFVRLMSELESRQLSKDNLSEYVNVWDDLENKRQSSMNNHKGAMIFGSLLYAARHPKMMSAAQKYYREGFGATCPIDIKE
jgi:hypothetical protein